MNEDYKKIIVIHPTPDNYDQYQFKDKTGNCFSYELFCNNSATFEPIFPQPRIPILYIFILFYNIIFLNRIL